MSLTSRLTLLSVVIGSEGRFIVTDPWWSFRYFKQVDHTGGTLKRFGHNFDGSGFRFLLISMYSSLTAKYRTSLKISKEDSIALAKAEELLWKNAR